LLENQFDIQEGLASSSLWGTHISNYEDLVSYLTSYFYAYRWLNRELV